MVKFVPNMLAGFVPSKKTSWTSAHHPAEMPPKGVLKPIATA